MAVTHYRVFVRDDGQNVLVAYHYRGFSSGPEIEIIETQDDHSGDKIQVTDEEREYYTEKIAEHHEWWND